MYTIVLWMIDFNGEINMQFTIEESVKPRVLRDSAMSIPKTIYANKAFGNELEIDSCYCSSEAGKVLINIWNKQHPLIHTWLVLSSASICFLFVLFFIVQ